MPTMVSSNEARNSLGKLLRQAAEENEDVIIKLRGEPTAVLISYTEYEALTRLRKLQKRLDALERLRAIRQRVQERSQDLTDEEAYRLAGFGERAVQQILAEEQAFSDAPS